ncbi:MAG: MFS transporter, partial [TACK group archaeon]|nr:MFS transporter [TACK group archaeon]
EGQYVRGSSLASAAASIADAAGYGLAGLFLGLGFGPAFALLVAVYLASSFPLIPLRVAERVVAPSRSGVVEGLRFVKRTPFLVQLMIIGTVLNLVFGMSGVMIASLVQMKFHLPSAYMSALILSLMLGMMIGSAASSGARGRVGPKAALLIFLLGAVAASMGFLGVYEELPAALLLGALIGVLNVMLNAAVLKMVPADLMARVNGTFNTFSLAVTFASGALGGMLISATSVSTSFLIVGSIVAVTAPLWLVGEAARLELPDQRRLPKRLGEDKEERGALWKKERTGAEKKMDQTATKHSPADQVKEKQREMKGRSTEYWPAAASSRPRRRSRWSGPRPLERSHGGQAVNRTDDSMGPCRSTSVPSGAAPALLLRALPCLVENSPEKRPLGRSSGQGRPPSLFVKKIHLGFGYHQGLQGPKPGVVLVRVYFPSSPFFSKPTPTHQSSRGAR